MVTRRAMTAAVCKEPEQEYLDALEYLRTAGAPKPAPAFDLPVASNVIDWVSSRRFLDFPEVYNHWGQYQLLRDLCQIRCPICNPFDPDSEGPGRCWGKSRAELEDEVLLEWQASARSFVCPKCKGTQAEFIVDGLLYDYNTLLAAVGMRGGKSASTGLFATYLEHMVYCLAGWERNAVSKFLGQAVGTTFDIAFVATSAKQTEQTIWDYFTSFRENSPWIQKYVGEVKKLEATQPVIGPKRWKYDELDKSVTNDLIGVMFQSLHSNSASMAGATRVAAFIDELARFDTTESKRGADEVWRVLSASLKTVRRAADVTGLPRFLFGAKLATSSLLSMDDKMMTMLGKADVMDNVLALKMATWDFNPQLPREAFEEEYAEDPIQAERDFGANPPLTETPLIEDVSRFGKSIESELSPAVLFRQTYPEDALGRQYIGLEVEDSIISPELPRFICFDAGSSFDSFAGAMAHPAWVEVAAEDGKKPTKLLLTVYDWVVRILPTEKPKRTVWFDSVVKLVEVLKEKFRINHVVFDRWQSEALVQNVRVFGVQADQENVKAADFVAFRSDCYAGKIKLLPPLQHSGVPELEFLPDGQLRLHRTPVELSPQAAGIYELVKLSRSEDLRKIHNPNKGKRRGYDSDDVAQVLVGVHRSIQKAMADDPAKQGVKDRLKREKMGGEMWAGGAAVQAMRHWTVAPSTGDRARGSKWMSYGPGEGPGMCPEDKAGKRPFAERGTVRVRRWRRWVRYARRIWCQRGVRKRDG